MKQVMVLKLGYDNEKTRKKVMTEVSGQLGIESMVIDAANMKLTVTGDIDAVRIVSKLRKLCTADILSLGPPKEAEKK